MLNPAGSDRAPLLRSVAYPLLNCGMASATTSAYPRPDGPALVAARSPPSTPDALSVKRHPTFWDSTAIAYLAAGIALLVCLVNLLR